MIRSCDCRSRVRTRVRLGARLTIPMPNLIRLRLQVGGLAVPKREIIEYQIIDSEYIVGIGQVGKP